MAETIKDFLVSVGFKVDGASERKFTDAIRSATLQADLLARGLEGAAKAIAKAVADISAGFESIYYTAQRANTSVGNLRAMMNKGLSAEERLISSFRASYAASGLSTAARNRV